MKMLAIAFIGVLTLTISFAFAENCCKADGKGYCAPAKAASKEPTEQDVVIDPVCGMDVPVAEAKYKYTYKGKTYHFCSKSCYNSFKKDPSKFLGKEKK